MNELRETYITIEQYLFPVWEEEFGILTEKQQEFIRELELVRPERFIGANLSRNGKGVFVVERWSNGPIRRSRTITADGTFGSKVRPKFSAI